MSHVVIVGGGISGLAAAWYLRARGAPPDVTVLEASARLGGSIITEPFAGVPLDGGPDSFLTRNPAAVDLAEALGLADDLVAPATSAAYLWSRGALRRLPDGLVLGAPTRLGPLWRSGIVSRSGVARAALDLLMPMHRLTDPHDESVAALVRGRLGREVQERLVDPLVGGINAGTTAELSVRVAAPLLAEAGRARSMMRGLRAARANPQPAARPMFLSIRGGMGRLVSTLQQHLAAGGAPEVNIRTATAVRSLTRRGQRWHVGLGDGSTLEADAVVLAGPAQAAAQLLAATSPRSAAALGELRTASVALTTLAYPAASVARTLDGSGVLVPRVEGRLLTACTWVNAKWPQLAPPGMVLMRASAGRAGDTRAMELDDGELLDRLHADLSDVIGVSAPPLEHRVFRWPRAFPQFAPGHLDRIASIEAMVAEDAPGVSLAGAWLRGVGIPTCISGARAAAEAAVTWTARVPT